MVRAVPLAVFVAALAAPVAHAGGLELPDAGPGCERTCDGDTLTYCDAGEPRTIDCAEVGTGCALISEAQGFDCVLGAGASCDPDYAFGASRCDRSRDLFCIDGACTEAEGPPPDAAPLEPSPGTNTLTNETANTNPFGCSSCSDSSTSTAVLGGAVLLLVRRRSLRPRR